MKVMCRLLWVSFDNRKNVVYTDAKDSVVTTVYISTSTTGVPVVRLGDENA
jgi:hypothetical protein